MPVIRRRVHPVSVDIMPILLELVGLPVPDAVEGMDLSHWARGESGTEPEAAFMQNTGACAAWENGHEWRALRDKRHTYAVYRVDGAELLFDHINDPYRMSNLVEIPAYRELEDRVEERTAALAEANDALETNNAPLSESYRKLDSAHIQLRETQTPLVQSEKMAASGHLVAGIAHEINNPVGAGFIGGEMRRPPPVQPY